MNAGACAVCAAPLASTVGSRLACGACLRNPPPFDAAHASFRYAYPIDRLVHGLKFRSELACGRVLGQLLARSLVRERVGRLPELIIPVPLAPGRYRERGYNQAAELALPIRELLRLPAATDVVVRHRETREQAALNRKERRRNIRRAFALVQNLGAQHVAILDDVVTTGSTVGELATVLRRAGAKRIEVWAVARVGRA